jgi:hypothetical protein
VADDIKQIREALLAQGWSIDDKRKGYPIAYPPEKGRRPVPLPKTPAGVRWRQNLIARLRRSGFIWPPPT